MEVLVGTDFFTVEILPWRGLVTYYVLFFLKLGSRRVKIAGITRHPDEEWMQQVGPTATQESWGHLHGCRYLLHDRDPKFCNSFRSMVRQSGVKPIMLPASSPNLNAFASRVIGGMVRFEYDLPFAWRLHYSWSWFAKLLQTYGYIRPHVVELNR